jgi:hypothetical protein
VRELRGLLERQSSDLKIEVSAEGLERLRRSALNPAGYVSEKDEREQGQRAGAWCNSEVRLRLSI